jgi:plastocyanin
MATIQVAVGDDMTFTPASVSINAGDTVQWVWPPTTADSEQHTVSADDGSWGIPASVDNGHPRAGDPSPYTFSYRFATAGTYPYYCFFHGAPGGVGMSGTVVVT